MWALQRTLIDVEKGEVTLRVSEEKFVLNAVKAMQHPYTPEECMSIDLIDSLVEEVNMAAGLEERLNDILTDAQPDLKEPLETPKEKEKPPKLELNSSKCVFVTADDIINKTFETSDAGYNLYVCKVVRFGVRKGDTTCGEYRTQCRRRFFCNKEGKRAEKYISNSNKKREHKALTHTGCEAMLAVYFDTKTSTWRVNKLIEKHNHDLVPQCLDLDNHIERTRRAKLIGGDSNAIISYLLGKADIDPMAMARYSATDEGRLTNLFGQRAFPSPPNMYIWLALIEEKQTATYTWLLQNFLEVMLNKCPSIVVTNGDEAIKAAIQEIFLNVTHRLCGWHIRKNVMANIKNKDFFKDFRRCLYALWHPNEFKEYWENMIKKYGLEENDWVLNEYEKRKSWASAYLRDKFCTRFRTTSRCEVINNVIKRFICIRQSILELVQNLEHALREYRHNELVSEFKTVYGEPILTTGLEVLEFYAANFTQGRFLKK
ncbi:protein FAR-RED IMPAIRED RESPONSE 1-like [Arachis ipaensis]|uniref:protein FAR-RED IMPAIRED RESPONSE 1-like n=1 Tax=Arachis ipaensis TaxID=130454 RepID=UPI000A2B1318|nr:protein FAR-RED IMPAIRED RESPONSE 1-like [Arachis ipaensis]